MLNQCVLSWLVRHLLKLYSMRQSLYFLRRILSFNCISLYACPMLYYCHSDGSSTYVTIFFLLVYTYLVGLLWKCTLQVYIGLIWVHLKLLLPAQFCKTLCCYCQLLWPLATRVDRHAWCWPMLLFNFLMMSKIVVRSAS